MSAHLSAQAVKKFFMIRWNLGEKGNKIREILDKYEIFFYDRTEDRVKQQIELHKVQ